MRHSLHPCVCLNGLPIYDDRPVSDPTTDGALQHGEDFHVAPRGDALILSPVYYAEETARSLATLRASSATLRTSAHTGMPT
jgi:hypothetical protein